MQTRATVAVFLLCLAMSFGDVSAQPIPGDVTFEVPVNLTRLSSYVSKVAVTCLIERAVVPVPDPDPNHPEKNYSRTVMAHPNMAPTSAATKGGMLFKTVELPVSACQVVTTAHVVVTVPSTPPFKPGDSMMYECALNALTSEQGAGSGWQQFDSKAKSTSLKVSPTPLPIWRGFVW